MKITINVPKIKKEVSNFWAKMDPYVWKAASIVTVSAVCKLLRLPSPRMSDFNTWNDEPKKTETIKVPNNTMGVAIKQLYGLASKQYSNMSKEECAKKIYKMIKDSPCDEETIRFAITVLGWIGNSCYSTMSQNTISSYIAELANKKEENTDEE